ncbi:MAG: hypothetical protein EBR81_10995, partial [Proteobacteria bacterium]|nr:hypothetical protein [Pseudomonadota bacterium]
LSSETIQSVVGSGALSLQSGTITLLGSNDFAFDGVISGAGGLFKTSGGTLALNGQSTFSGGVVFGSGVLQVGTNTALGTGLARLSGSTLTSNNSSARSLANDMALSGLISLGDTTRNGALNLNGNVSLISDTTFNVASDVTVSGVLSGEPAWVKAGAGRLTLSGANTQSGNASITDGVLSLTGSLNSSSIFISGGSLLLGAAGVLPDSALVYVLGGILDSTSFSNNLNVLQLNAGLVTGTGLLTANYYLLNGGTVAGNLGAGAAVVNGDVLLTGITAATTLNVSAGNLTLGASNRIGDTTSVNVSTGTLSLGSYSDTVGLFTMVNDGVLDGTGVLTAGTYVLRGGVVNGGLGLGTANVSTGVTILNGSLAALAVNVDSGSLLLGSTSSLASGATVNVSGGALSTTSFNNTIATLNLSGGVIAGSGTLTATNYALSGGVVAGNLGLGTAIVTGPVSLTGTTAATTLNINTGGVLTLGSADRISAATNVLVDSGRLALGSFNNTVNNVTVLNGGSLAGSGTLTATNYFLQGGIIGANLGTGTATVTTGSTTLNGLLGALVVDVNSGSLILGGANRLASGATVTLGGGTLDSGANATTITTLQLNSGLVTGSGLLTATNYNLVNGEVAGALGAGLADVSGTVSLTGTTRATTLNIGGGGLLTLGSASRIGDTTAVVINSGQLVLAGNEMVSTFAMYNGGVLGGSGTLTAATYALEGGIITANLGAGIANLAVGNTTLNGLLGAASVNITSGSLILGGANRLASGATVTLGGGALDSGANATMITMLQLDSGVVTGSGLLTATTYNLVTGEVAGAFGAGTANVTGAVSLTGTTAATTLNINTGGVLTLGSADRIADATNLVVNGGEFALGTNTETLASVSLLGGKLSGSGTLTGTSYNVESGTVSLVLAGAGVVLTKSNSGTVLLEGANIFTGGVVLNAGTLVLGNAGALNAIAPNAVVFGTESTAKLQLNGYSVTLASLATNALPGSPVVENA